MGGIFGLLFALGLTGAGFLAGRAIVARAYGIRDRRAFSLFATWLVDAPSSARIFAAIGSFAGVFLVLVMTLTVGTLIEGRYDVDETSMRVTVTSGGPGSKAGMKDGDRITLVNGTPVGSWSTLQSLVAAHQDEAIDVTIERAGDTSVVRPIPRGNPAKIMVGPFFTHRSSGVGEALGFGLRTPIKAQVAWARALVRILLGEEKPELSGPVGVGRETSKGGIAFGATLGALLVSTYLWVPLIFSVISVLGGNKKKKSP